MNLEVSYFVSPSDTDLALNGESTFTLLLPVVPSLQFNVDLLHPCAPTGITFQIYLSIIKNKSENLCCVQTLPSMLWRDLSAFIHISPWWIFLFGIGEVETLSQAFTQESLTAMKTFQYILKFVAQN